MFRTAAIAIVAILVAVVRPARATDLRNVLTDYILTSWHMGDSLPPGAIYALAQDNDGYLWVGSSAGLFRFDGIRFVSCDEIMPTRLDNVPVRALHVSQDGSLWVGFAGAGGAMRLEHGNATKFDAQDGHQLGLVTTLLEDSGGSMWAGSSTGLYRFNGVGWQRWTSGLPVGAIISGYVDKRGVIFVGHAGGVYRRVKDGEAFEEVKGVKSGDDPVQGFGEDQLGVTWVTDSIAGFRSLQKGAITSVESGRGNRLLTDRAGSLWVGTAGQGLWRVRIPQGGQGATIEKARALSGLLGDGIYSLLEDHDGNIWAGTTEGLNRLTPRKITQIVDLGLATGVETTPDGTVWVATASGLVQLVGADHTLQRLKPLGSSRVRALHVDRNGILWVATDQHLARVSLGRVSIVPLPAAPSLRNLASIASDSKGGVWLYDLDQGLHRLTRGRLEPVATPADLARERMIAMQTDSQSRVWLMFAGGQVALVNSEGTLQRFGPSDGLDAGPFSSICEDPEGAVWLAGSNGVSKFQGGRFRTVRATERFPAFGLAAIILDNQESLWLGGRTGILRIDRDEFDKLTTDPGYHARYNLYDRSDGVAGAALQSGSNRRVIRARDGRLWFVTFRGITIIDPQALRDLRPLQATRIETVLADGQKLSASTHLKLAPRTRSIEIDYTVPDITSALKTRFRYRLQGFDKDWVEAGTRRQAFFTNLAPGTYRFFVMASSAQGTWGEAYDGLEFSISPMFYETGSFYVVSAVALIMALWTAWRLRLRRVRRQFALLLAERARLSREVHDTLLQSLVGTALQLDVLANSPDAPGPTKKELLVHARRQVEDYIREARQTIWDLRSPRLQHCDLGSALDQAGRQAIDGKEINFQLSVTGTPRRCPTTVETQILRIGQEAILNAVHHGRATTPLVELGYQEDCVALRVVDDGVGFDLGKLTEEREQHYGLVIMKERASEVGGTLQLSSTPAGGTTVTAIVPTSRQPESMAS